MVTTHNAMLMNQYTKDQLIGVSVVYREREKGTSRFISFVDMNDFPAILAAGGLGNAMIDNRLTDTIKGEKTIKGVKNKAILADSVEAVIAAIYLDSGIEDVEKFIISNLKTSIEEESKHVGIKDYKTVLQEKLQENGNVKIEYKIIAEEGPDHDKNFVAQVLCDDKVLAHGRGKSKKKAEMEAAKYALKTIKRGESNEDSK